VTEQTDPVDPPDWLDELDLSAGPPWLAMGTRGLTAPTFVADEHRERDLALKASLLRDRADDVFAAIDSDAVRAASNEVRALVEAAVGQTADPSLHPLDAAARLVQEDLCVLVLRDGAAHLDAASLCFPSYWRLADKLGRPLAEVHAPVAHYEHELAAKVDGFMQRLRPDRPVWRRNWSIHDDPAYFLPVSTPPAAVAAPDGLFLRSERQTLTRLQSADAVLFTIRTQQAPLAALASRPDVASALAAAIDAWSPEMRAYKGGHGALIARDWLASCSR
jgi:hypothetical protein